MKTFYALFLALAVSANGYAKGNFGGEYNQPDAALAGIYQGVNPNMDVAASGSKPVTLSGEKDHKIGKENVKKAALMTGHSGQAR
jgi:hypothetical protein